VVFLLHDPLLRVAARLQQEEPQTGPVGSVSVCAQD
jgi:hypothetical protein